MGPLSPSSPARGSGKPGEAGAPVAARLGDLVSGFRPRTPRAPRGARRAGGGPSWGSDPRLPGRGSRRRIGVLGSRYRDHVRVSSGLPGGPPRADALGALRAVRPGFPPEAQGPRQTPRPPEAAHGPSEGTSSGPSGRRRGRLKTVGARRACTIRAIDITRSRTSCQEDTPRRRSAPAWVGAPDSREGSSASTRRRSRAGRLVKTPSTPSARRRRSSPSSSAV